MTPRAPAARDRGRPPTGSRPARIPAGQSFAGPSFGPRSSAPRSVAARSFSNRSFSNRSLANLSFAALSLAGLPLAVPALAGPPAAAPTGVSAIANTGNRGQESRHIRLLGLMQQGERAVALVQFGPRRPQRLLLGETGRGWTLVGVGADSVRLESASGRTIEIPLPETAEALAPAVSEETDEEAEPGTAAATPGDPAPAPGANAYDPMAEHALAGMEIPPPHDPATPAPTESPPGAATGGERRFSRDEVRLRLATELPRILTGATVLPRIRGDEVVGLELVSFPTDTILGETGLLPNDVLLRVNDREVRGVESLAILAQRFQTANRLELAVERNGEVVSLRYTIE